jgi:precorrin-2 dehydrogenase / sirohydrochlorin ferrochelatase
MSKVSDSYEWEEMCDLTPEDMDNLLLFYPANKVPPMQALKALRSSSANKGLKDVDIFDGSFGFSI